MRYPKDILTPESNSDLFAERKKLYEERPVTQESIDEWNERAKDFNRRQEAVTGKTTDSLALRSIKPCGVGGRLFVCDSGPFYAVE